MKKSQFGFTFIELLVYIALVSVFIGGAIMFGIEVIQTRAKTHAQQEVNQNIRMAAKRIMFEIRNASTATVGSGTLTLGSTTTSRNPTVFDVSSGRMRVGFGSAGSCPTTSPCNLTSSEVTVSNLTFTSLSTTGTINVKFSFTVAYNNPSNRQEYSASASYIGSAELRSN